MMTQWRTFIKRANVAEAAHMVVGPRMRVKAVSLRRAGRLRPGRASGRARRDDAKTERD